MVVELQGLLEERNKLDTKDFSTRSKAAKALWLDKLAEIDTRFKLEKFVDRLLDLPQVDQIKANKSIDIKNETRRNGQRTL